MSQTSVATAAPGPGPDVDARVLEVVDAFVTELGTLPPRGGVSLDDSLDRDLGLGSLERAELLFRLEEAFGVRFPDSVMGDADSGRDLARAVRAGGPRARPARPAVVTPLAGGAAAPASAATLVEVLAWHAERHAERTHVVLVDEAGVERPISYGALWQRAAALATVLRGRGVHAGDALALMLRTEEAFFVSFFATLIAGAVPVPIYPPFRPDRLEEYAGRQVSILRNAQARLLLTFREAERVADMLRARVPTLRAVVPVERLERAASTRAALGPARGAAGGPALIQYTSGSTGDPKGVLLSHANILANIRAFGAALGIGADDVAVSWLPLYHDMGLIGSWLGALYHGIPVVILSPLAFLARPARWLQALAAHRATLSPAPNFAFDLCVRKIRDDELEGVDLRAWRLALNGSEAVSAETIERFTRRFQPYGFRPEAMCPVYGLAESAVALTTSPAGAGPRIARVARETFTRLGLTQPAVAGDATALTFVSCGRPLPGHDVRIVDERGAPVGAGIQGRVEFRGPSVTRGYFGNAEATRAAWHEGWMDSGDLGYQAGGELYITGRRKDIVIKAGRNLYPQEIEAVVGDIPGIRKGCVATFGVADPAIGTERLVIVAETREREPGGRERLRAAVVDRVVVALGLPPDVVVITAPGAVLKTSSGKIRRSATRDAYTQGRLERERPSVHRQWARLLAGAAGARLGRLGRAAAALAWAPWAGLLLLLGVPLLAVLARALPRHRVDRAVRLWCRALLTLAGCRPRVEGLQHLLRTGAVVYAANHASYLDAVALLAAVPADFRFVAKRELLHTLVVGTVIRRSGHLTVDRVDISRGVADAEQATGALRAGVSLFVFPEGTFRRQPGLLPFRLGAFKAAVESGRPIVPVAIRGTREILPDGTWLPRPGTIRIAIAPPVAPRPDGWREMIRLRDAVRGEIARRVDAEADATSAPNDDTDTRRNTP